MQRLDQFRIFYNHTIHPELMRMERLRIRLVRLLASSLLFLAALIMVELYLNILVITLVMAIPITFFVIYLSIRIRRYVFTFKPNVMNLVCDFIDDGPNMGTLHYDPKRMIPKETFLESGIFATSAPLYEGEDFFEGKVGEMPFELCELTVAEYHRIYNKLDEVFKGIFLCAAFPENVSDDVAICIWPRQYRQFLSRSIRAFTFEGGKNADDEILNPNFKEAFMTYATRSTHVAGILSDPMQEAIVEYRRKTGKEIYLSFIGKKIYLAVTEPRDILEPNIFRSNVSFELVRTFFEDITLLLEIVKDFDQTH